MFAQHLLLSYLDFPFLYDSDLNFSFQFKKWLMLADLLLLSQLEIKLIITLIYSFSFPLRCCFFFFFSFVFPKPSCYLSSYYGQSSQDSPTYVFFLFFLSFSFFFFLEKHHADANMYTYSTFIILSSLSDKTR